MTDTNISDNDNNNVLEYVIYTITLTADYIEDNTNIVNNDNINNLDILLKHGNYYLINNKFTEAVFNYELIIMNINNINNIDINIKNINNNCIFYANLYLSLIYYYGGNSIEPDYDISYKYMISNLHICMNIPILPHLKIIPSYIIANHHYYGLGIESNIYIALNQYIRLIDFHDNGDYIIFKTKKQLNKYNIIINEVKQNIIDINLNYPIINIHHNKYVLK